MPLPAIMALLSMPSRRESVLPELVAFFRGEPEKLRRFLVRFAGTEMRIPPPDDYQGLLRDEHIAHKLGGDSTPIARAKLCRDRKVPYPYLCEIYEAVYGRVIPPPETNGTARDRVRAAHELLRAVPGTEKVVCQMYGLSPAERKLLHKAIREAAAPASEREAK